MYILKLHIHYLINFNYYWSFGYIPHVKENQRKDAPQVTGSNSKYYFAQNILRENVSYWKIFLIEQPV